MKNTWAVFCPEDQLEWGCDLQPQSPSHSKWEWKRGRAHVGSAPPVHTAQVAERKQVGERAVCMVTSWYMGTENCFLSCLEPRLWGQRDQTVLPADWWWRNPAHHQMLSNPVSCWDMSGDWFGFHEPLKPKNTHSRLSSLAVCWGKGMPIFVLEPCPCT